MFRMTTLKISLLSALATLFLLVSMFASTGTASAHAASCQPQQINSHCPPRPQLAVYDVMWPYRNCEVMYVKGANFAAGQVTLVATQNGSPLFVSPSVETGDVNGNFSSDLSICSDVPSSAFTHTFLVGTDSLGHKSNTVLL